MSEPRKRKRNSSGREDRPIIVFAVPRDEPDLRKLSRGLLRDIQARRKAATSVDDTVAHLGSTAVKGGASDDR